MGIRIKIDSIFEISHQRSSMMIEINVTASWTDKNIKYKNLNENYYLNALSLTQKKSLWMPKFIFYNCRDQDLNTYLAMFDDEFSTGYIKSTRNIKSTLSGFDELQNTKNYKGTDA